MVDAKKSEDFVHLHTHSDLSQLDGCGKVHEYVDEAARRGNPAISFTDHGTMRGYMAQYEACKKAEINPIYGVEFYVSKNMYRKGLTAEEKEEIAKGRTKAQAKKAQAEYEASEGIRQRWHLTVHAETMEGMKNLFRLTSKAFIEGFYYRPRIDLDTLCEHNKGLIVSSGCVGSPIHENWFHGKRRYAVEWADRLHEVFKDRFFLELQPHDLTEQIEANKLTAKLRKRYGGESRYVATQDAHYIDKKDAPHHDVLLCIGTGKFLSDPMRMKFSGDEYHMRTRREMFRAFKKYHSGLSKSAIKEALDSTMLFNERCQVKLEIDYHAALLPDPGIPKEFKDDYAYLKDLCVNGWVWREIPERAKVHAAKHGMAYEEVLKTYRERLKYELSAIKRQKFVPYFILIHDLYRWARGENIMVGPGRGSVAGCLIGYLIGITAVDPIEHGLIFERFINPNRVDMPDIDMDFEDKRRHEVFAYLRQKYGNDKVCQIATVGKLSGKQCLKDVSRVLQVPYAEVNQVTNSIIERSSGDERASQTIEDSFAEFEVCREFNKKYPDVLHHSKRLEGMAKNLGIHAAGAVASPVKLVDVMPLEIRKHDGQDVIVSAVDMYGVAANGLVKLDVLGLRTLTVLREALESIEQRHGRKIDLESAEVRLDDPKVLQGFTDHDYGGVFQYDTPSADKVCSGVSFDSFEDIAAMAALNRPGTSRSGLATKFVDRKKHPEKAKKHDFHPSVTRITADTLGIIVYQEHVIKIFTDIAGFAPGTADSLRKTIAKKVGDETIGKERENFVRGATKKTGMSEETANKIMSAITFFGSYGFNKSHATAYGMIAYWCMYLKTYYPLEFYWSLLKNEPDRIRIQQYVKHAKKKNIRFLPPSVNTSKEHFSIDGDAIRGSLVDIKGVGTAAAKAIIAKQPYTSFMDFLNRVDRRKAHKGVVRSLVLAGALDEILPNPKWLVENIEVFWKYLAKGSEEAKKETARLLDASKSEPKWDKEERQLVASKVNPLAFGKHPMDAYKDFLGKHIKLKIKDMSAKDFYKINHNKSALVGGTIVEVKFNQIGDFHTGLLPSEEERTKMFWGKRYANVNIEDVGGVQNRIKFDWDIYPRTRPIIELGLGAPVLVMTSVNAQYENMRAFFAIDIEGLRKKILNGEKLDIWERIVTGDHPVRYIKAKSKEEKKDRWANKEYRKSSKGGVFWGVVTNVRLKYDKRGQLMAFFGLIGGNGLLIDVICFASQWDMVKDVISAGSMLKIELNRSREKGRGLSHFFNGGLVKRFKIKD